MVCLDVLLWCVNCSMVMAFLGRVLHHQEMENYSKENRKEKQMKKSTSFGQLQTSVALVPMLPV